MSAKENLRAIRKKLRLIETIDRLQRPLNDDEILEVSKKKLLRNKVSEILGDSPDVGLVDLGEAELGKRINEDSGREGNSALDAKRKKVKFSQPATNWLEKYFKVSTLNGHSDIINAVAIDGNTVVSASRDTTLKVWDIGTEKEIWNLGCHTGPVTCLVLVSVEESKELQRYLGSHEVHRLLFSGSTDCSVNVWSITTGKMLKTWYTFNIINCMAYMGCEVCIVTGTDGGKLEVWDAVSGGSLFCLTTYNDSFTSMKALGFFLYTANSDGMVNVWELENRKLKPLFSIADLPSSPDMDLILRSVICLDAVGDWIHYGDDGVNIKAFDWKTGEVKKYRNHVCDSGVTDSVVCVPSGEIISSSYNMDLGTGCLNLFSDNGDVYKGTLDDGNTGRIFSVDHVKYESGARCLVSGGKELKVWREIPEATDGEVNTGSGVVRMVAHSRYSEEWRDSSCESSASESEAEFRQSADRFQHYYIPTVITGEKSSVWSWCCVL